LSKIIFNQKESTIRCSVLCHAGAAERRREQFPAILPSPKELEEERRLFVAVGR
jgi:hypothetical protein